MTMTLHQLKLFDAVTKHLSFTKAARELHISQPSVYQQIKALEESCAKKLYVKIGRGIALTSEGLDLCSGAREILLRMRALEAHFRGSAPGAESFAVGGCHALSASVLPTLLARYKRNHPGVKVSLTTKSSAVIEQLVIDGKIDVGIITNPTHSSFLTITPYRRETMVITVASRHALARKKELTLSELAKGPLIIRERKKSTSREILDQLEEKGYELNILMICDSAQPVKYATMMGQGIGIIYKDHVAREIRNGELKVLKVNGLKRSRFQSYII